MTPLQIKKWFAEQSRVANAETKDIRYRLNIRTSDRLRPLRKINQTDFAKLSGLDRSHLNHLESGKRNWNAETVAKYISGAAKQ